MSSKDDVLVALADSSATAVVGVLELFSPSGIERGQPVINPSGSLLGTLPMPSVASSITYVDGVSGGNIFGMTRTGARRLAAAMMMQDPDEIDDDQELSELELSAVGEAMNQMMAAAAAATSTVLGEEVDISPPQTRFFESHEDIDNEFELTPHIVTTPFTLFGEPCRLVQLVPNAFIVRLTKAMDELPSSPTAAPPPPVGSTSSGVATPAEGGVAPDALRDVPLRVWAELGRCQVPVVRAAQLLPGEVVDLDADFEEVVTLFVNGRRYATGVLVLADGEEWAVRVEEVLEHAV